MLATIRICWSFFSELIIIFYSTSSSVLLVVHLLLYFTPYGDMEVCELPYEDVKSCNRTWFLFYKKVICTGVTCQLSSLYSCVACQLSTSALLFEQTSYHESWNSIFCSHGYVILITIVLFPQHFRGLSFPTISSVGPNAAVIHYSPEPSTCSELDADKIYLFDSGAQVSSTPLLFCHFLMLP